MLRQLAYYNDKLVPLEWRIVEDTAYEAAKSRVNKISHLLYELVDPSFLSLKCIGFLEDLGIRDMDLSSKFQLQYCQRSAWRPHHRAIGVQVFYFPLSLFENFSTQ